MVMSSGVISAIQLPLLKIEHPTYHFYFFDYLTFLADLAHDSHFDDL